MFCNLIGARSCSAIWRTLSLRNLIGTRSQMLPCHAGVGDAVWNTQITALLGDWFDGDLASAFANFTCAHAVPIASLRSPAPCGVQHLAVPDHCDRVFLQPVYQQGSAQGGVAVGIRCRHAGIHRLALSKAEEGQRRERQNRFAEAPDRTCLINCEVRTYLTILSTHLDKHR